MFSVTLHETIMEAAPGLRAVLLPATSAISRLHQRSKDTIRDVTRVEPPHTHLQLFYLEDAYDAYVCAPV